MAKAGRKRKQGVKRQPNGQASRSAPLMREKVKATVIDARMRQHGLKSDAADSQLAGYAIGRMALAGDFGRDWQPAITAVEDYVMAVADYMRIKCPLEPMPKAMDYLAGKGTSLRPEPSLKTVDRIVRNYEAMTTLVASVDGLTPMEKGRRFRERIMFHEAAFHDRLCGTEGKQAVISCVGRLMRA
ncbi:hypothetical protein QBK99_11100 [Corticibacterium sp. UT-5YL-CI-8]|nr:hypothetical protein [Tianweitania sp. UT-5YL-CI-8]